MDNKENIVETVDQDGKELKLIIRVPGHKILQEAQMIYNLKLTSLIRQGSLNGNQLFSKEQLDQHLANLNIWTEEDARQFMKLQLELRELEFKLTNNDNKELKKGKKIAFDMKTKRAALLVLYSRRVQFEGITMESIADNEKFKFLITKCIIDQKTEKPLFKNINDYEMRQGEPAGIAAATALAGQLYGYDEQTEAKLPENRWLQQYRFADEMGRLINEDNHLIDMEGHLIDEDGHFVNQEGKLIDNQGRLVDASGNFVVATKHIKPKKKKKCKRN